MAKRELSGLMLVVGLLYFAIARGRGEPVSAAMAQAVAFPVLIALASGVVVWVCKRIGL
jgi:hypothetical protein